MKKTMKKQSKKFPLWGFKGLLSVALSALGITAFAQAAEVCQGTGYTIANAVEASAGSEYRWLENGNVLANTNQATFDVPNNKAAGVYTYVRQSKSAGCPDWQSSNEFTVTVFSCTFTPPSTVTGTTATFTDPRDGKKYKTVVMPDGKVWFAQNLNYTQGLTYNAYATEANGKPLTSGASAIGSYWCPVIDGNAFGDQNLCNIYGALYTWETAMMVDGKYADESKTSSAWDESWISPNNYPIGSVLSNTPNADRNNARGGTTVKGGGRGICPLGWHIPTIREWANLLDSVRGAGSVYSLASAERHYGTDESLKLKYRGIYTTTKTYDGSWAYHSEVMRGQDRYGFALYPSGFQTNAQYDLGTRALVNSSSCPSVTTQSYWRFDNEIGSVAIVYRTRTWRTPYRCLQNN